MEPSSVNIEIYYVLNENVINIIRSWMFQSELYYKVSYQQVSATILFPSDKEAAINYYFKYYYLLLLAKHLI